MDFMKNQLLFRLVIFVVLIFSCSSTETDLPSNNPPVVSEVYFPPLDTSASWETTTISDMGWNDDQLPSLLQFLEDNNTKGFIILYRGKIALETYMNGHTENSPWYWASAGKILSTSVVGIAQDENLLSVDDKVSDYLGLGWTSLTTEKENLITNRSLLAMTSGLDEGLGDDVSVENLKYKADTGTRWAYHNVYKKLQDVITVAANQSFTDYFNTKLKNRIGMTGAWITLDNFNVYWSNTRSMARFGLMVSANGTWNDDQIISETFLNEATESSQNINKSYGYLWWLNGKSSYQLPQSQFEFQGELIPNAPDDLFCALGRDDQKLYIVPSKNLVIVRMGNAADNSNFALSSFDNEFWEKLYDFIN